MFGSQNRTVQATYARKWACTTLKLQGNVRAFLPVFLKRNKFQQTASRVLVTFQPPDCNYSWLVLLYTIVGHFGCDSLVWDCNGGRRQPRRLRRLSSNDQLGKNLHWSGNTLNGRWRQDSPTTGKLSKKRQRQTRRESNKVDRYLTSCSSRDAATFVSIKF